VPPSPGGGTSDSDSQFAAAVTAVTSAFGDPTRREIYLFVRANPGTTASEVAGRFSLHPNVARHHLERLLEERGDERQACRQEGARDGGGGRHRAGDRARLPVAELTKMSAGMKSWMVRRETDSPLGAGRDCRRS